MRPWLFVGLFLAGFAEASSAGARGRAPAVSPARFAAAVGSQLGAIASLPAPVAIERLEVSVGSPAEAAAAAAIIGAAAYHQRYLPAAIATLQAAEGDGGKAAQALEGWAQRAFDERAVFEARDALARMARLPARVEALFDGGRRRRPEDPDRSAGEWLEFFGSLRLYQAVDFAGLKLHEEAVRRAAARLAGRSTLSVARARGSDSEALEKELRAEFSRQIGALAARAAAAPATLDRGAARAELEATRPVWRTLSLRQSLRAADASAALRDGRRSLLPPAETNSRRSLREVFGRPIRSVFNPEAGTGAWQAEARREAWLEPGAEVLGSELAAPLRYPDDPAPHAVTERALVLTEREDPRYPKPGTLDLVHLAFMDLKRSRDWRERLRSYQGLVGPGGYLLLAHSDRYRSYEGTPRSPLVEAALSEPGWELAAAYHGRRPPDYPSTEWWEQFEKKASPSQNFLVVLRKLPRARGPGRWMGWPTGAPHRPGASELPPIIW